MVSAANGTTHAANATTADMQRSSGREVGSPGLGGKIRVVHFRARGPLGDTVLDPVFAELLFVARWRGMPLELVPTGYPSTRALGQLPVSVGGVLAEGRIVQRPDLLKTLSTHDGASYGSPLSIDDEAFRGLLRNRVGMAITALLFGATQIWEEYTKPTLLRSAPTALALVETWCERRRQRCGLSERESADVWSVAQRELIVALEALAARLGSADCFGESDSNDNVSRGRTGNLERLNALDACAYGYLSVLFSIPCAPDSGLREVCARFPTLGQFLDRLELRFGGVWPERQSFLAALDPTARLPAAMTAVTSAGSVASSGAKQRHSERGPSAARAWWQVWGWSTPGGGGEPPEPRVRSQAPPPWHATAFGIAAVISLLAATGAGCAPPLLRRVLDVAAQAALSGSGTSRGSETNRS